MLRIARVFVMLATLATNPAFSNPAVEDWTSNPRSYDLEACGSNRLVVERLTGNCTGSIARFTVKPKDNCLKSTGERSEVVLGGWQANSRFRVTGTEGVEYYRVSVKLSPDWIAPQKNDQGHTWGTFFQLHGPNEYAAPPAISINAEDKFSLFVLGGDMNQKVGGRRFLTKSDLNVGKWVAFVLEIRWATDSSGAIAVYRKDEGDKTWENVADIKTWDKVADIKGIPTLQYRGDPLPKPHYWKAGIYRSESNHTNTLWLGPIVRGRSFAEVNANWSAPTKSTGQ